MEINEHDRPLQRGGIFILSRNVKEFAISRLKFSMFHLPTGGARDHPRAR
jgi:hypothetical protein